MQREVTNDLTHSCKIWRQGRVDEPTIRVSMICTGPKGAVEYWFEIAEHRRGLGASPFTMSGVEMHSLTPINDGSAHHEQCEILGQPCWHEGTSSYASSILTPGLFDHGEDWLRCKLEETYRDWFGAKS